MELNLRKDQHLETNQRDVCFEKPGALEEKKKKREQVGIKESFSTRAATGAHLLAGVVYQGLQVAAVENRHLEDSNQMFSTPFWTALEKQPQLQRLEKLQGFLTRP